ncbi:MAG TPA: MFS transporter, partial [Firmicutes bacterium]|nr:MFS transporter [Bacillota bacterium]
MQQERSSKVEVKIWSRTYNLVLGIALLGMMGGALLGPVLPALMEPFGVAENQVGYVLAVYTFCTALSMPFLGPMIDKYGRKKLVIPCLILNGAAGMLGAFAPSFTVLLILRAFQGLGIAGLLPVAMTLIRDFFEGPTKVKAMGYL